MQGVIEITVLVFVIVVFGVVLFAITYMKPIKDDQKSPEVTNNSSRANFQKGLNADIHETIHEPISESDLLLIAGVRSIHRPSFISLPDHIKCNEPSCMIKSGIYKSLSSEGLFVNDKDTTLSKDIYCKVMITDEGQILLGDKLDKCLERALVKDDTGDINISPSNPIVRSKLWIIKDNAIFDLTENFCLGIVDKKLKLLTIKFIKENNIFEKVSSWNFRK
jgi:hypothetical protein